jgi:hypothetical protein
MMAHLLTLLLEVVGVAAVVGGVAVGCRYVGLRSVPSRLAMGAAIAVLVCVSALAHVGLTGSVLAQDRGYSVSAQLGLEHCLYESLGGGPIAPERALFVAWVKRRLPPGAVYTVVPYAGTPDGWCLTMVLLPALPLGPGAARPGFEIVAGVVPPDIAARIARHDPTVQVFAPGYALAKVVG